MKTAIPQFLIVVLVLSVGSLQNAQAVSPVPDGGYAGANTAEGGSGALFSLTTGANNTALGSQALYSVTTGSQNTATGSQALKSNVANHNTADGFQALVSNTTASNNTATGWRALFSNTTAKENTAVGSEALYHNTTGVGNTANGFRAVANNSTGQDNTAVGTFALNSNTTADENTAVGAAALSTNATGAFNTALGGYALFNNTNGSHNIAVGQSAGCNLTSGDNNIDIGNEGVGVPSESNTIRIGSAFGDTTCGGFLQPAHTATYIAGISGQDATGGDPVFITTAGKLGTVNPPSSARVKEEIKPMNQASEAILALKPVTFRYKKEFDPTRVPQFGLVAEEVEKVNPDLVKRDREGKVQTVRYEAVNAMLLNEFLKEHKTVQEQGATIARLEKQIETLTAAVQKVSTQFELNKSAPQTVLNTQ
jgi:hypothetical protein